MTTGGGRNWARGATPPHRVSQFGNDDLTFQFRHILPTA